MSKNITITAMLSVLTIILFSCQMFIPVVGIFVAYFSIIPLMFIYEMTNTKYFFISLITCISMVMILNDPFGWIFFDLLLVPPAITTVTKNKILKLIMIVPIEIGFLLLFKILVVNGSKIDMILSNIWYILGILFYFAGTFFYRKAFLISKMLLKKINY